MKTFAATFAVVGVGLLLTAWLPGTSAQPYSGPCLAHCCCKVCSSPSNEAYPYGLTTVPISSNPIFPQVTGSNCHFPVWSEQQVNDTYGHPVTPPNTLFWTAPTVFGDSKAYPAPFDCDCCQFSGVDTSCAEVRPAATQPKNVIIVGGYAQQLLPVQLLFTGGYQLSKTDLVELRNDTFCGYTFPRYVKRGNHTDLNLDTSLTQITWNIKRLPNTGCYRVCYYHSTLTTPTWYDLGTIVVNPTPQATVTYVLDPRDVLLETNSVTFTFFGKSLLSPFNDIATIFANLNCGGAALAVTGTNGFLSVMDGAEWCKPAVIPQITALRPLNYIDVKYTDCALANRVYQSKLQWQVALPVGGRSLCYSIGGTGVWHLKANFPIPARLPTKTVLMQLFNSTGGKHWIHQTNWGSAADPCTYHGVRCNAVSLQVEALYLGRNNLTGTIPSSLFTSMFFNTLIRLHLDQNNLFGTIPNEIGLFRNMQYLNLGFNSFSGTIPGTLQRASLQQLYISNNLFSGQVPDSLDALQALWDKITNIAPTVPSNIHPACPQDVLECSNKGSTDIGVTDCGYTGITEQECVVRGCCFNAQAPLTFGGSACFTMRSVFITTHPQCAGTVSCRPVLPPAQ